MLDLLALFNGSLWVLLNDKAESYREVDVIKKQEVRVLMLLGVEKWGEAERWKLKQDYSVDCLIVV